VAQFEAADRHAAGVLKAALSEWRGAVAPQPDLGNACEGLREGLRSSHYPFDWLRRGAGLDDEPAPAGDAELLQRCAAGTIAPREDTGLGVDEEASIMALEHADWLGAIVSAVRAGPGADASPDALVAGIYSCPEVKVESDDPDGDRVIATAFLLVLLPWACLGLVDDDERLTPLGAWALPRALALAWGSDFDAEPG
jgi:hypothetical protein